MHIIQEVQRFLSGLFIPIFGPDILYEIQKLSDYIGAWFDCHKGTKYVRG